MTHCISAGVIVEHDHRLLLVRHVVPGRFDFWVAPGGGAQGTEPLRETARREVREETGLDVEVRELMYIEEFHSPDVRYCKFWFSGWLLGGTLSVNAPEARADAIVEAGWFGVGEFDGKTVFPSVLVERYWSDRLEKPRVPVHLGTVRTMEFW